MATALSSQDVKHAHVELNRGVLAVGAVIASDQPSDRYHELLAELGSRARRACLDPPFQLLARRDVKMPESDPGALLLVGGQVGGHLRLAHDALQVDLDGQLSPASPHGSELWPSPPSPPLSPPLPLSPPPSPEFDMTKSDNWGAFYSDWDG